MYPTLEISIEILTSKCTIWTSKTRKTASKVREIESVSPWDEHRKSVRYNWKTYELGLQSTYLRLKSRILSLFKPYHVYNFFLAGRLYPTYHKPIKLSQSRSQTASPFRGDGREVRKYSRNGIKGLMPYCIFIQSQHACLEQKRRRWVKN